MHTHRRKLTCTFALITALAGCAPAARIPAPTPPPPPEPTLVYVVRHGERASADDTDSPLSEAGHARAQALAEALAYAGIDAVYHTQYVRTRDTGSPVAHASGATMHIERVTEADPSSRALAERILAQHRGESVLVVGHSDTVHLIVRALGGTGVEPLEDHHYDRIFLVVISPDKEVSTVRARFGSPSPAPE